MVGLSHLALAGALAACLAGIGGYVHGIGVGVAQERASQKRADDAAQRVRAVLQGRIDAAAAQHQAQEFDRQSAIREIYHESQKIVERPVYRNLCVDADGVRLLDRAAATANGAAIAGPLGAAAPSAGGAED